MNRLHLSSVDQPGNRDHLLDEAHLVFHGIEDHTRLIKDAFSPAVLRQKAEEHIAFLEVQRGRVGRGQGESWDVSEHGVDALDELSNLAHEYRGATHSQGFHHVGLIRHHQSFNRQLDLDGDGNRPQAAVSLLEVVATLKRDGIESAMGVYARHAQHLKKHGFQFLKQIRKVLKQFYTGLLSLLKMFHNILKHVIWLMLRSFLRMYVGIGASIEFLPIFGAGPVLQVSKR